MKTWLKMLGSGDGAMAETIVPQVLRLLRFPRRPSVAVGDKLVLYALGHDRVFAIVEAFSPVRPGEGDNPWRQVVPRRPRGHVPALRRLAQASQNSNQNERCEPPETDEAAAEGEEGLVDLGAAVVADE